MIGAFLGDSIGAYCEFKSKLTSTKISDEAMKMPGGGKFNLFPGQVTDDSELAMHILKSLLTYNPKKSLESQYRHIQLKNAREFLQWRFNNPFDIGYATQKAAYNFNQWICSADSSAVQPF